MKSNKTACGLFLTEASKDKPSIGTCVTHQNFVVPLDSQILLSSHETSQLMENIDQLMAAAAAKEREMGNDEEQS
ncbi:hypothetical protein IFM89_026379 [Coptis chinensis]|uniref:Uncharacterized protein n=1 Tax=Coptis chinensis TaxID=261450 RepID=A0A835IHF4_9MAGN|nr:hypothetical protein IFM89_026379 [Coptis chinensis]